MAFETIKVPVFADEGKTCRIVIEYGGIPRDRGVAHGTLAAEIALVRILVALATVVVEPPKTLRDVAITAVRLGMLAFERESERVVLKADDLPAPGTVTEPTLVGDVLRMGNVGSVALLALRRDFVVLLVRVTAFTWDPGVLSHQFETDGAMVKRGGLPTRRLVASRTFLAEPTTVEVILGVAYSAFGGGVAKPITCVTVLAGRFGMLAHEFIAVFDHPILRTEELRVDR